MTTVDRDQALAFRLAGHHLHRRTDALTALGACGIQESPPGWAPVALHARSTEPLPDGDEVVLVNAMRNAPHYVPRADMAVFTVAIVPPDEGLKSFLGALVAKEVAQTRFSLRGAVDLVSDAARDALADGPLERDAFHQELRERLPAELLGWCRGCESHHVRSGLWRGLGPLGVTEMPAKATWALARCPDMPIDDARAELARRFLRCFGPASHSQLASWAETSPAHARTLIAALGDEVEEVRLEGAKLWILAADRKRLETPPAARGVRLLGGFDPYVSQPDRETLVPDKALAKRMFPAIGRPGVVLHDGALVGLWKARKKGKVLEVEPQWLVASPPDVDGEARAVARLRGCESARVVA